MHRAGASEKLVGLLKGPRSAETAHRALLALRIMSDKEADRLAIMRAGGVDALVHLLQSGPLSESAEFATAVLGNLAAGSQIIKDKIREVGHQCLLMMQGLLWSFLTRHGHSLNHAMLEACVEHKGDLLCGSSGQKISSLRSGRNILMLCRRALLSLWCGSYRMSRGR